jgi:hypothetical protein
MPDRNAAKRRRRNRLKSTGITNDPNDFTWLCRNTDRVGIVSEGDSWFAYPRKYLLAGPSGNIIDHIVSAIKGKDKANLLRLASNGDEAVQMIAGEQKHELAEILKKNKEYIKLILFSGGGNDVVGKWDMERLLNTYQSGYTAADCVNQTRLNRKMKRVILAYEELLELVKEYSPDATVITHTYDRVMPKKMVQISFGVLLKQNHGFTRISWKKVFLTLCIYQ